MVAIPTPPSDIELLWSGIYPASPFDSNLVKCAPHSGFFTALDPEDPDCFTVCTLGLQDKYPVTHAQRKYELLMRFPQVRADEYVFDMVSLYLHIAETIRNRNVRDGDDYIVFGVQGFDTMGPEAHRQIAFNKFHPMVGCCIIPYFIKQPNDPDLKTFVLLGEDNQETTLAEMIFLNAEELRYVTDFSIRTMYCFARAFYHNQPYHYWETNRGSFLNKDLLDNMIANYQYLNQESPTEQPTTPTESNHEPNHE